MMQNTEDKQTVKIVTTLCTISAITISTILLYLTYSDSFYEVGQHKTIYIPTVIVILEFIKVNFSMMIDNKGFSGKENKTIKKSYMKVKMKEIFKCLLLIVATVIIYYIIAVLFGAGLFDKCEETLMLSVLVASLTVVPSCLNLGAEKTIGFLIGKYSSSDPVSDMILQYIQLTFFGTWFGAIAIPLDWERPWQEWPITCYIGALLGYFVSSIVTLIKLLPSIVTVYTGKSLKVSKTYNIKSKI